MRSTLGRRSAPRHAVHLSRLHLDHPIGTHRRASRGPRPTAATLPYSPPTPLKREDPVFDALVLLAAGDEHPDTMAAGWQQVQTLQAEMAECAPGPPHPSRLHAHRTSLLSPLFVAVGRL
jgi:hypothetical protein